MQTLPRVPVRETTEEPAPTLAGIQQALDEYGLQVRGVFAPDTEDRVPRVEEDAAVAVVLVGNVGSSLWPAFSGSPEYADGQPEPLDRWSRRIGESLARRFGANALFPFGGPPFHPFQRWAARAGPVRPSRLHLLIDPKHGLWHAYRFALALSQLPPDQHRTPRSEIESPCLDCPQTPCLQACPVGAFEPGGYRVEACCSHLAQEPEGECLRHGCAARLACPVGTDSRYVEAHAHFHQSAFLRSRPAAR